MNTSSHHGSSPLLDVRELCLRFHKQKQPAVDRVSFNIMKGRTLGLVGASGAGKSSIARAIMRLAEVDSGQILFKGEDVLQMPPRQLMACRQRMQLVFQDPSASLSPKRTVGQKLQEQLLQSRKMEAVGRLAEVEDCREAPVEGACRGPRER